MLRTYLKNSNIMNCLHNCLGTFCKVLGRKYVHAHVGNNPVLVNIDCDTVFSRGSNAAVDDGQAVKIVTEATDADSFLHFYIKTSVVWIDGFPALLDKLEDGIELNFDAIHIDKHGFQAVLLWKGNKPSVLSVPKSGEFMLLDIYHDLPVKKITVLDGNPVAFVTVDGDDMKLPFSRKLLFIDGDTNQSDETFAETLESELPSTATLFRLADEHCQIVYHCQQVTLGNSAKLDIPLTYTKGKIYVIDDMSEIKEITNPSIIYYDIPFNITHNDNSTELSFRTENVELSLKNYTNYLQELKSMSRGIGHIYYNKPENEWQVLAIKSDSEGVTDQKINGYENLPSKRCGKDQSGIKPKPSKSKCETVSDNKCLTMSGLGYLLKESDYLLECNNKSKINLAETVESTVDIFSPFLMDFNLKNCSSLSGFTLREIIHLKDLLNSTLPKELPVYLEKAEGKLTYHENLKMWFIICKQFNQCILFSCSYLTAFYYKGELNLAKKINIEDGTVLYVDAMLSANCLNYIPVLVYDNKANEMNLVTDKYIYYYNIKGKLMNIESKEININAVIDNISLNLNDIKFRWGTLEYDFDPDTEVNIHVQKHITKDTYEVLFIDQDSLGKILKLGIEGAVVPKASCSGGKYSEANDIDGVMKAGHNTLSPNNPETNARHRRSCGEDKLKLKSFPYLLLYHRAVLTEKSKQYVTLLMKLPDGRTVSETLPNSQMLFDKHKKWIPVGSQQKDSKLWCDAVVSDDHVSFALLWEENRPFSCATAASAKYFHIPAVVKVVSDKTITIIIWFNQIYEEVKVNRNMRIFNSTGDVLQNLASGDFVLVNIEQFPAIMSGITVSLMFKCSNSKKSAIVAKGIFADFFKNSQEKHVYHKTVYYNSRPLNCLQGHTQSRNLDYFQNQFDSKPVPLLQNQFETGTLDMFQNQLRSSSYNLYQNQLGSRYYDIYQNQYGLNRSGLLHDGTKKNVNSTSVTKVPASSSRKSNNWTKRVIDSPIIFEGEDCLLLTVHSNYKTVNTVLFKSNFCFSKQNEDRGKVDKGVHTVVAKMKMPVKLNSYTISFRAVAAWNGKMKELKTQIDDQIKNFKKGRGSAAADGIETENLQQSLKSDAELLNAIEQLQFEEKERSYSIRTLDIQVQVVTISGDTGIVIINPDSENLENPVRYGYFSKNVVYYDNIPLSSVSSEEFALKMQACISDKCILFGQAYECKQRSVDTTEIEYSLILMWNEEKPTTDNVLVIEHSNLILKQGTKATNDDATILEPPLFICTSKPKPEKAVGKYRFTEIVFKGDERLSNGNKKDEVKRTSETKTDGAPSVKSNQKKQVKEKVVNRAQQKSDKFSFKSPSTRSSYSMTNTNTSNYSLAGMTFPLMSSAACGTAMMLPQTPKPLLSSSSCISSLNRKALLTGIIHNICPEYGQLRNAYDAEEFYIFTREKCFLYGICLSNINLQHILKPDFVVEFVPDMNYTASRVWIGGEPQFDERLKLHLVNEWCLKYRVPVETHLQLINSFRY